MTDLTPASPTALRPVVFVHGLWLHARSWQCWIDVFREAGYDASAPGWPGEKSTVYETRAHPGEVENAGFEALVGHYADAVFGVTPSPVLIGHAYGARLVRRLAQLGLAGGAIVIAAGGGPRSVGIPDDGANRLDPDAFAEYYGGGIRREESDRLYELWAIPAPRAAVVDADPVADRRRQVATHAPLLMIVAGPGDDQTQQPHLGGATDLRRFTDRGPSLTIDSRWLEVAESCLAWLDAQEL